MGILTIVRAIGSTFLRMCIGAGTGAIIGAVAFAASSPSTHMADAAVGLNPASQVIGAAAVGAVIGIVGGAFWCFKAVRENTLLVLSSIWF